MSGLCGALRRAGRDFRVRGGSAAADAPGWAVNGPTAPLVTLADTIKFAERHSQPAAAEKQLQLAGAHFTICVISVS
ncbi:hypothetical protein D9882_23705 [Salmonella enterica]|nr:hypothetical protein [Salmonella enterica]